MIHWNKRFFNSFFFKSSNSKEKGKRYKAKKPFVLFNTAPPIIIPKMSATSRRNFLTKRISAYKLHTLNVPTKLSYKTILSYTRPNGYIAYNPAPAIPIHLFLNTSFPRKNNPIIVANPAKDETILPASKGSLMICIESRSNQMNNGCFPSVREMKRQLASCLAICAHLV